MGRRDRQVEKVRRTLRLALAISLLKYASGRIFHLAPLAGRVGSRRWRDPGEGLSASRNVVERPLTPTLSPQERGEGEEASRASAYFVYSTSPSITMGSDRRSFIGTQLWVFPCVSVATTL
jgi:hypothetical protein